MSKRNNNYYRSLNYRSRSYSAPYAPRTSARSDGRGFKTKPAGRYVYSGGRNKGTPIFQPGIYVNAGRDRGTSFVRYVAPKPKPAPKPTPKPKVATPTPPAPTTPPPDPRYPIPPNPPQPRPPADTISPGKPGRIDGGGRELRIRESPARRTAFSRGDRARGSRRSARVGARVRRAGRASLRRASRSVGGLGKPSRTGVNV
jgi:hypothetical protein